MAGPKKAGRPRKEIDWAKAEQLAAEFNTGDDIAAELGVHYDTLLDRIKERGFVDFSDWYKRFFAKGKTSLRKMQFESAKKGNVTMQIWLGKQYLDQRDTPVEGDLNNNIPAPVYTLVTNKPDKTSA